MKKICLEMPVITECVVSECVYNLDSNCHARAISIGNSLEPGCDTFMSGARHTKSANQIAGIGDCKTAGCKFNKDLECMADSIQVGMVKSKANCMTFELC